MSATYTQVKQALNTVLSGISGLTVYNFIPGQINCPAAVIAPGPGTFYTYRTSNVSHDLSLMITVFVQRGQDRSADDLLSMFIADSGDLSVYATVAADPTLGGVVDSATVTEASDLGVWTFGEITYLGVNFAVEVLI